MKSLLKKFPVVLLLVAAVIMMFLACKKDPVDTDPGNTPNAVGQAIFWSATDLGCGNVTVNCEGISKTITNYYSNGAPCGATGCATFDLAPGTYSYTASCTGLTWSGSVTITSDNCSKIQLTSAGSGGGGGGGGTSTGQGMFWAASDLGCGTVTVSCNGISRTISSFYSSGAPTCGAAGCATFDLNAGTYSYTASCSGSTWNGSITIAAGACSKVQLTNNGGGGGSTTGQGMFWTSANLNCGTINVNCNGITRTISSYYSSGAPACGATGCANFNLSPGTYSYSAACSGLTWNGSVTITSGGCSKIQLTGSGTGGSTTGQAMFWTSTNFNCGNITVSCNGVTKTISSYYSSGAPSCGATGCATFTLAPGSYSYSASCSGLTWSGTVTVTANGCTKIRYI